MGHRDLLAWYAIRGMYSDVLALAVTMACAYAEDLELGRALHSMAIRRGFMGMCRLGTRCS
uniref:Uncharacterized protein n=1 Tax=Oryza barthii TaxID=65489 RepID=A0A0D3H381_9ORYZ